MNHSCVKIGFFLVINPGSSRVDFLAVSLVAHAKLKNRRLPYACGTSSPLCPRCTMSCHCSVPPLCESLVKCASCRFCVVPWAAEPSLSQLSGDCSGRSTSPIPVLPPSYTLKGVTRVCHTTAQGRKEEERRSGVKEAARSQKWRANSKDRGAPRRAGVSYDRPHAETRAISLVSVHSDLRKRRKLARVR